MLKSKIAQTLVECIHAAGSDDSGEVLTQALLRIPVGRWREGADFTSATWLRGGIECGGLRLRPRRGNGAQAGKTIGYAVDFNGKFDVLKVDGDEGPLSQVYKAVLQHLEETEANAESLREERAMNDALLVALEAVVKGKKKGK